MSLHVFYMCFTCMYMCYCSCVASGSNTTRESEYYEGSTDTRADGDADGERVSMCSESVLPISTLA